MVHYIKPDWLEDICKPESPNNLAPLLVEVLATVLDNEVIFENNLNNKLTKLNSYINKN